ncbi:MAG TPA: LytTR family DNA-binding domain-containing protein, partial [Desulfobacterales bacterium]
LGLGIDYLFQLDDWSGIQSFQDALPVIAEESIGIVSGATLTWIALNAPRVLQLNFTDAPGDPATAKAFPPKERLPEPVDHFLHRIPAEIGNDIIYLQSELHYVRVVTTAGQRLVLFNLKDAIADLEKRIDGIQTHRSYWVAGTHARVLISQKNKKLIRTTNDHRVPVSRRKLAEVRHFMRESRGRP